MGTRSLTHVREEGRTLVTIYRQFDGYPEGHGAELRAFVKSGRLGNGIPVPPPVERFFNGAGCFAAQLVAHLKEGSGGIYLYPPDSKGVWEEYTYVITVWTDEGEISLTCMDTEGKRYDV